MVVQTGRSWETPTAPGRPGVQLTSLPALLTQVIDVMGRVCYTSSYKVLKVTMLELQVLNKTHLTVLQCAVCILVAVLAGVCQPLNSSTCTGKNDWLDCAATGDFFCPAIERERTLKTFPFSQINISNYIYSVAAVKCRPFTTPSCSFLVLLDHGLFVVYI